jgi:hypothetical protein
VRDAELGARCKPRRGLIMEGLVASPEDVVVEGSLQTLGVCVWCSGLMKTLFL